MSRVKPSSLYLLLSSSVVYHESGQTKLFVFAASPHAALRNKNKDLLAQNQDNVSDWSDMSTVISG
jgi:hypothetical protein